MNCRWPAKRLGIVVACCFVLGNSSAALGVRLDVFAGDVVDGRVAVSVVLRSEGSDVGGTQNDLLFDAQVIHLPSAAACRTNPEIGTTNVSCESVPAQGPCKTMSRNLSSCGGRLRPPGCDGQPANIDRLRIMIAATFIPNNNPIPDGAVLYTCEFSVVGVDALPIRVVNAEVIAADLFGSRLSATGLDGIVGGDPLPTPTIDTPGPTATPVPTRRATATRTARPTITWTRTVAPQSTATPSRTRRVTATGTVTPTFTVTWTPAPPFCGAAVCVDIGTALVDGEKAFVEVTAFGANLGGTQNDILFDSRVVRLASAGACRINPAIGTDAIGCSLDPVKGPCKSLASDLVSCGESPIPSGCDGQPSYVSRFRGIVAGTAVPSRNPLPRETVLYTCEFDVLDRDQLPTRLDNAGIVAANPLGARLAAKGLDGRIVLDLLPEPTATATVTPTPTVTATPTSTPTVTWTRTLAPRPTATPIPTRRVTATRTPRPTVTATWTPAPPFCGAAVCVDIGTALVEGEKAFVEVTAFGANLGGTQNDILFDSRVVRLASAGACRINPAIGTDAIGCSLDPVKGPCKSLASDLVSCGESPIPSGCDGQPSYVSRFRGIVAGTAVPSRNPLPRETVLYSCEFDVLDRDQLPTRLDNAGIVAANPLGARLAAKGLDGRIVLDLLPEPTPTATLTPTPTVTATPTPTPTVTWTRTPTSRRCTAAVCVDVGTAVVEGTKSRVEVVASGANLGGTQNDILFDSRVVRLRGAGACRINPAIGTREPGCFSAPVTDPCKSIASHLVSCGDSPTPSGCDGQPSYVSRFRGIIAGTAVPGRIPIPSGSVLYSCEFDVVEPRGLPTILENGNIVAANPLGARLAAGGLDGSIVLELPPMPSPTPTLNLPGCDTPVRLEAQVVQRSSGRAIVEVRVGGGDIGGAQNDLVFDTSALRLSGAGACRINPAIGTDQLECDADPVDAPCKTLSGNLGSCGKLPVLRGCENQPAIFSRFRAIVGATAVLNRVSVPSGSLLYSCEFEIVDEGRLPASVEMRRVVASDPVGKQICVAGAGTMIERLVVATATATSRATASSTPVASQGIVTATPSATLVPTSSPLLSPTAAPATIPPTASPVSNATATRTQTSTATVTAAASVTETATASPTPSVTPPPTTTVAKSSGGCALGTLQTEPVTDVAGQLVWLLGAFFLVLARPRSVSD